MQFSLRLLLAAVAFVAIGAGLWVAEPSWQVGAVELSLSAWVLASAVSLIAHSRGRAQAFWLGLASEFILPTVIHLVSVNVSCLSSGIWHFDSFVGRLSIGFRTVLLFWAFAPLVGLLCVFTHWLLIRSPESKA